MKIQLFTNSPDAAEIDCSCLGFSFWNSSHEGKTSKRINPLLDKQKGDGLCSLVKLNCAMFTLSPALNGLQS